MKDWQLAAVRRTLGVVKDQRTEKEYVRFAHAVEVTDETLAEPVLLVAGITRAFGEIFRAKQVEIELILTSASRAEWLARRKAQEEDKDGNGNPG